MDAPRGFDPHKVPGKAQLATTRSCEAHNIVPSLRQTYLCNFCRCLKSGAHRSGGIPEEEEEAANDDVDVDEATRLERRMMDGPDRTGGSGDSVQNHLALPGRLG